MHPRPSQNNGKFSSERRLKGFTLMAVSTIAVLWSFFQLSVASWLVLDAFFTRAIHLGFALLLAFLTYPLAGPRPPSAESSTADLIDRCTSILLGVIAALSAVYVVLDYQGVVIRYGLPLARDVVMGLVLIALLLEAARRVVGPALPLIALVFILYAFLGPHMPEVIAFKGVSLNRFIGQMTMSTEGVYGIPLDVSAHVVFLFVLFGAFLQKAGAGNYFIKLALSILGGFKGGPAKAAIVGSGLTGMVSGSSIANIVTTGTFTIPLMKKVGYPPTKAAAIEVAASTDGQLAPPIMGAAAFIIAEYLNVPYMEVVKAAAVPACASYVALIFISHLEASKLGLVGIPRKELPSFTKTFLSGVHYLLPLGFLVYQLMVLRRTPQAAAFNAIWVMGVVALCQHPVRALATGGALWPAVRRGLEEVGSALVSGARNMVGVAVATAAAGIIVGVVAMGLGGLITQVIDSVSLGNIFLMLVVTACASLIIGMGLPTTATYIVMASLTAPAIVHIAQDGDFFVPLMAAHLFCFFFGILADDTPPVGIAAYAAAAIAKSPPVPTGIQAFMYDIRTAVLPFMFIFNHDLILHNVSSWTQGVLIAAMTCLANCAFVSATQGWLATRNRFHEIFILLVTALILMRPGLAASWLGIPHDLRYWLYLMGGALFLLVYGLQRWRLRCPSWQHSGVGATGA